MPSLPAGVGTPAETMGVAADEAPDIVTAWQEAALREFVGNEDMDVRCCILPQLRLEVGGAARAVGGRGYHRRHGADVRGGVGS